ncbi:phosphate regulon sensor histidine kinase PhoR [Thalassotalea agarivorans]|uniref:Phosphate regulon sensor protein PhoR n=1 Tax=Thalassotalea agarivorans TaxID=349064 RepID=A0A1H9YMR6_THASX|nr:phosphate regulon sensor histidine kinase PhoR [Thalassotalea agarivorans]SES70357.1 two-component system, OmpR family, phosphate regulon sensor histidine kinase PhoR [Thalassotalea agarivorans]
MYFRLSIKNLLIRLSALFVIAGLIGFFIGYFWQSIAIVSLALLFWHYRHVNQLVNWLWQSKSLTPPLASGTWGNIYDGLYRLIRKSRIKQKALNQRIRRFKDGAEALPDAALLLSDDLTITWGNKKAKKLIGVKWPADEGQRIDNLIRFPEFSQYIEKNKFDKPCVIPSPILLEVRLEIRIMPYGSDQYLLLARDISKVYKLEEMRRDFVANVSHELKTPLTVVRGYVEMIQASEQDFSDHWLQAFSTIEDQVTRMDRLVQQLLVLSRVEVNTELNMKQKVNVPALIDKLVNDVKWLNQDKQHRIEVDVDESLGVKGQETELKSACLNLITNAINYTPAKGTITVSWKRVGDKARFSVKDTGVGIKPADINRLTERFYRVDKSRSRDTGGSGLGLAIVKHVINHHDGELIITSELGKGSEFIIEFGEKSIFTQKSLVN